MKKLIFTIVSLTATFALFAQSFDDFIQGVEQNNPQLIALQKWLEAEKTLAKTGITPNNPQVSFNYLYGSPQAIGNQSELEITQSFKLPGYYTTQSAIQQLNYQQKQTLANKEKQEILHRARTTYFALVWLYKKEALLRQRNNDAEKLLQVMKTAFDKGEISKPAYNKAQIYAIGARTDHQQLQSELKIQLQYLQQLNGDKPIEELVFDYPHDWDLPELKPILTSLHARNPDLLHANLQIQQSEKEIKKQRMSSLPSFEAGYVSEAILDQKLRGFHAGISIPLWQNKNTVKYAKLHTEAYKAIFSQKESELKAHVSALLVEATALKHSYEQMKVIMTEEVVSHSSIDLLKSGHISFTDYLIEMQIMTDNWLRYFDCQREYYTKLSALKILIN
jgi:outer membrane protein, heavy metal efflux system